MTPLFVQNPSFRNVMISGYVIWVVIEAFIAIRQPIVLHNKGQLRDRGSRLLIALLIGPGIFLCLEMPRLVPTATITRGDVFVFWLGIVLVFLGLAFRVYAISVLGRYFTPSVAVVSDQRLVEEGPYKFIRHPSYTGLFIMFLGFGLCATNWLSLLVLMVCALIGLSYRISVEERVLQQHLGQPYREYMQRTKRLIPFVV